jgi:hypothetical protein
MKVRVFVASPSDVTGERDQLLSVVEELNKTLGRDKGLTIELVGSESCRPGAGAPQASINKQVGPFVSFDIFVGIMWQRLGTPTKKAGSGTEEEFNLAYESWKKHGKPEILFYFCTAPAYLKTKEDNAQQRKVIEFREKLKDKIYEKEYRSLEDFTKMVRQHLYDVVSKLPPPPEPLIRPPRPAGTQGATTALDLRRNGDSSPPPRWWVALVGWLAYLRAKEFRKGIFEHYRTEGLARPLVKKDFKTEFNNLGRSNVPDAATKHITIINGPVGVGKTTYLDHLFKKLIGRDEETSQADLFIKLDTGNVAEAIWQGDYLGLWQAIYAFFAGRAVRTGERRLTPAAVAYALAKKRVLLIVEDMHLAGSSKAVLEFLAGYFELYHPKGSYSILGSTREAEEKLPDDLVRDAQVETLHPIGQKEAQLFFYKLCDDNGLPREKLTEHGDALHRAFSSPSLQTPLFVVICAWLAASEGLDVGRVLQMNTRELFDNFIDKLYRRSTFPKELDMSFRDLYERLALALWPVGESFDERDAAELITKEKPPGSPFDERSLEENGFLRKDAPLKLSFPHQMMAEYLAAVAMVRRLQFGKLRENSQYAQAEGLVPFLAELIQPPAAGRALELLAQADPSIFVEVVALQANPRMIPAVAIAGAVAEWATPDAPRPQPRETWERLHDILASTRTTGWAEKFCEEVARRTAKATGAGVEALTVLGGEAADDYLVQWMKKHGAAAFRDAVETPQVQEFLLRLVERAGLTTGLGQNALSVLASCRERSVRRRLVKLAAQDLDRLGRDDFEAIIALGKEAVGVLGYACEHKGGSLKRDFGSYCANRLRKLLVSPGQYYVEDENGQELSVTIKKPILIPCRPEGGGVQTSSQMQALVSRTVGIKKLMTKEQALIVRQHFSHVLQEQFGVAFADTSRGQYEALRDGEKVGLFFFYRDDRNGKVRLGSTTEHFSDRMQVGRKVVYRAVEEL